MFSKTKQWLLKHFNRLKHKRWFQIFMGLVIVRWLFRIGVVVYLLWLAY